MTALPWRPSRRILSRAPQGEVVEFEVATQTYYGHFVGLDENITFTLVPEPGSGVLLLLGLVGFRWFGKRRS